MQIGKQIMHIFKFDSTFKRKFSNFILTHLFLFQTYHIMGKY